MKNDYSVNDRFWSKVDKSGDCWEWTASRFSNGYGQFTFGGYPIGAHRVAFEETKGLIPTGLVVMHSCDNRGCVNPAHLSLGTPLDNALDKVAKGREYHPDKLYEPSDLVGLTFKEAHTKFGISRTHFYRLKRTK